MTSDEMPNDGTCQFVADAASVGIRIVAPRCTDAGRVGHDRGTLRIRSSSRHSSAGRRCSLLLIALLAVGCGSQDGPERIAVYGTVTRDGKGLEQGSISFLPGEGHRGPAANGTITAGEFRFITEDGPAAGPHRVLVTMPSGRKGDLLKSQPPASEAEPTDAGEDGDAAKRTRWEFEVTVSAESAKHDFELE